MSGPSAWLRQRPETFWVQLGVGSTTAAWGAFVAMWAPPLHEMPVYDAATQFVPGWAWGRFACGLGLAQVVVAVAGLRVPRARAWPRRVAALLVMLLLSVLAVSMRNSGEPTTMPILLLGLALMNVPVVLLPLLRPR